MTADTTRRIFLGAVSAAAAVRKSEGAEKQMERVTGTPITLESVPSTEYGNQPWGQEAGTCAFHPFPEKTGYFGDESKRWMLNFRVRSLEKMAAQLREAGITVTIDEKVYPNGRFSRLHDPEGNPIELWEPVTD